MRARLFKYLLILTIICIAPACSPGGNKEKQKLELYQNLEAPAFHMPRDRWRAVHMLLTGEGLAGAPWTGGGYELGECRICHRAELSCNPCHQRMGAPRMKLLAPERRPGEAH